MNNILLVLLAVVVLSGCSKDDEKNSSKSLLVKKIEIGENSLSFTYNGNKIIDVIGNDNSRDSFTYNGELIVKTEAYRKDGSLIAIKEYFYENGNLKSIHTTDGIGAYELKEKKIYTYNNDGTVSYNIYEIDSKTEAETLDRSGIYTYSNGNIIKEESSNWITTYEYDTNSSPYKNIIGFDKLTDYSKNLNNRISKTTIEKGSSNKDITIYKYEYNSEGYPILEKRTLNGIPYETTKYSY